MISVVVGGQYGSEGKGKIAAYLCKERAASLAVRVGGPNSGHTVMYQGRAIAFRQLPTAAVLPDVTCYIPSGAFLNVDVLLHEIALVGLDIRRVSVHPFAVVIEDRHRRFEVAQGLVDRIASTGEGVSAALSELVLRDGATRFAKDVPELFPLLDRSENELARRVVAGERAVLEGTQGFGLSLLSSRNYPFVTSREVTAAGVVAEAGLPPHAVDEVVMVLRAHPIRVGGNSGPLENEISWQTIDAEGGGDGALCEFTTVTGRIRRVARFESGVVARALVVNSPTRLALNHLDYLAIGDPLPYTRPAVKQFISDVEASVGRAIDLGGFGPDSTVVL